jgi:hypothetical protein
LLLHDRRQHAAERGPSMMRHTQLEPRYVNGVPRDLELGVLYVSMQYSTVVHSCCCGCGNEVVTPLTPTDWRLTFDGETISLWPSVGNWNLPCRSHYLIRENRVIEAGSWSNAKIEAERKRDTAAKANFYGRSAESVPPARDSLLQPAAAVVPKRDAQGGLWAKLRRRFG